MGLKDMAIGDVGHEDTGLEDVGVIRDMGT